MVLVGWLVLVGWTNQSFPVDSVSTRLAVGGSRRLLNLNIIIVIVVIITVIIIVIVVIITIIIIIIMKRVMMVMVTSAYGQAIQEKG